VYLVEPVKALTPGCTEYFAGVIEAFDLRDRAALLVSRSRETVGLGYRRLSVSPFLLPPLRRRIQQVDLVEARRLAARAIKLGSRREIAALLAAENARLFGGSVP